MYKNYTISDIAKSANVSIATVSRVLNNADNVKDSTREKVLSVIEKFDQKRKAIAPRHEAQSRIILASFPELVNPFYANIFRGISSTASAHGYKVVYYQFEQYTSPEAYSFFNESAFYDGLIIAHAVPDYSILENIAKKMPVVMCSEHSDASFVPFVAINDFDSAYNAVKYLISTGRRKIAMLNSTLRNNYAIHREKAFRKCLSNHSIPINEEWIIHLPAINYDLGLTAASSLLENDEKPDAVFCVSDVFAAAVINSAKNAGLSVPGDISVVGFDNIDITTMTRPTITTVAQPSYQIGVQACNLLIDQLEYPSILPNHVILNTELILREST